MSLDLLEFIDSKGGNAEAIRESQRKRFGTKPEAVQVVDDVVRMYDEWVKSTSWHVVSPDLIDNMLYDPQWTTKRTK